MTEYTEGDVQLVAHALLSARSDECVEMEDFARRVLAALDEAGRLLPTRARRKLFNVWYRSLDPDGRVWCDSTNPDEVRRRSKPGFTFQKLEIFEVHTEWVPWVPVGSGEETPEHE